MQDGMNGTRRFRMRQKLVSIGDDYWIEDEDGRKVYKIDGKAMRIRDTLVLEDADGHTVLKIQQKMARLHKTMTIEDSGGRTVATVKKAHLTPLRDRWVVHMKHGPEMDVTGNIIDHEYTIAQGDREVAVVTKTLVADAGHVHGRRRGRRGSGAGGGGGRGGRPHGPRQVGRRSSRRNDPAVMRCREAEGPYESHGGCL